MSAHGDFFCEHLKSRSSQTKHLIKILITPLGFLQKKILQNKTPRGYIFRQNFVNEHLSLKDRTFSFME
jgi:hypothetical protein